MTFYISVLFLLYYALVWIYCVEYQVLHSHLRHSKQKYMYVQRCREKLFANAKEKQQPEKGKCGRNLLYRSWKIVKYKESSNNHKFFTMAAMHMYIFSLVLYYPRITTVRIDKSWRKMIRWKKEEESEKWDEENEIAE